MKTKEEVITSTKEQNKDLVRRAIEQIWNGGNYDTIEEFVARDFVAYASTPADEVHGPENAKQYFMQLHKAFPDIRFTIVDQVAEGDKVATHWTASGTHKGEFRGLAPTGKRFTVTAIDIDRIVNGRVSECWSNMDELSLLRQLGAIPTSG
jgi:steroid delta-isomerase-like uncharacterized protein